MGNFDRHQADTGEAAIGKHGRAAPGVGRGSASPSADRRGFGQETSPAHVGGREHGRERGTTLRQEGVPSEGSDVAPFFFVPGPGREPFHALLHAVPATVCFESGISITSTSTSSTVVEHFHERVHAIAAIGFIRFESNGGRDSRRRIRFARDPNGKAFRAVLRGGTCSCRGGSLRKLTGAVDVGRGAEDYQGGWAIRSNFRGDRRRRDVVPALNSGWLEEG